MSDTKKYIVVEALEIDGVAHAVDAEVDLTDEVATPLVEAGKVRLVEVV